MYGQPKKRGPPKGTTRGGRRGSMAKSVSASGRERQLTGDAGHRALESDANAPPSPASVVASASLLALQGHSSASQALDDKDKSSVHRRAVSGGSHEGYKRSPSSLQPADSPLVTRPLPVSTTLPDLVTRPPLPNRKRSSSDWADRYYSNGAWAGDRIGSRPTPFLQRLHVPGPSQMRSRGDETDQEQGQKSYRVQGRRYEKEERASPQRVPVVQQKQQSTRAEEEFNKPSASQSAPPGRYSSTRVRGIADSADAAISSLYSMAASASSGENGEIGLKTPVVSEKIQLRLFATYWSTIAYHWPMLYKPAFPKVNDVPYMKEEDHPLLFNAMLAFAASTWDKMSSADADGGQKSLTSKQLSDIFLFRAKYQ